MATTNQRSLKKLAQRITKVGMSTVPPLRTPTHVRATVNSIDSTDGVLGLTISGQQAYDVETRFDVANALAGASTVFDTNVAQADAGEPVIDPVNGYIPAGTYVGTVVSGESFTLVNSSDELVETTGAITQVAIGGGPLDVPADYPAGSTINVGDVVDGLDVDGRIIVLSKSQSLGPSPTYDAGAGTPMYDPVGSAGSWQLVTGSGEITVPSVASHAWIVCVGGGAGGCSGGVIDSSGTQVGGPGGGAGQSTQAFVAVTPGQTLTCTVGAGGTGGPAVIAGENAAGNAGGAGGTTSVTGTGVSVTAPGGGPGDAPAEGSTTTGGGFYAWPFFELYNTTLGLPGSGGAATGLGGYPGGPPVGWSGRGGGAGGPAGSDKGGAAGSGSGIAGSLSGSYTGGTPSNAPANTGQGGDGGGAGVQVPPDAGTSGAGGNGGSGFIVIVFLP
jgi:hypothetical protein